MREPARLNALTLLVPAIAAFWTALSPAGAQAVPEPVSRWYQAFADRDWAAFDTLLLPDAEIELRDIGIVQTRGEFLESLEQWAELNAETVILSRLVSTDGEVTVMAVCYRFASNEMQTRESFTLRGGAIALSVQEPEGSECRGF